ncbi:glucose-6-phosphate isomerase [Staphylococcus aureus]|nr:glucose-6-phosphate isomerase [Staphylococcus aureus]
MVVNIPQLDEETFGYVVYFFELACAMSGYQLGVNPFNQPGVEAYKQKIRRAFIKYITSMISDL